jgi:hypothetical protein
VSFRRRPALELQWVSESWAEREQRTRRLARTDDLLMAVEDWNEVHGADVPVSWELLNQCLRGGAGAQDGAVTGAELIEYLLDAQRGLMRPLADSRTQPRTAYASRR